MVTYEPVHPASMNENVLRALGRKIGSGGELTLAENLMAMTATARVLTDNYGPGPAEMVLQKPELPEQVKGVLAHYTG